MIIRKLFGFEGAHVVRNCTSRRCSLSIHGHSYKVEVLLQAAKLDNGGMVYDFGLLKTHVREFIDAFDHATTFWDKDDLEYIQSIGDHSARWISLPVNPSAEEFARVFFLAVQAILGATMTLNDEGVVTVHSVIVHETATGYAQAFTDDCYGDGGPNIDLSRIRFSDAVKAEWVEPNWWDRVLARDCFINPAPVRQVKVDQRTS